MDRFEIERETRRLQTEIWGRREVRFGLGVPGVPTIFDPRNVADFCELHYDTRERLEADYRGGGEVAGIWQRDRRTILISLRYSYEIQRFTAAHEIGHFILHPHVGDRTLHRELPVNGVRGPRPPLEQEADFFASCLLMPRQAVVRAFQARFVAKPPLALTETVAWHLKANVAELFAQPRGSLLFAEHVARAQQFGTKRFESLASYFGVSARAMAIRLDELGLVVPYLRT